MVPIKKEHLQPISEIHAEALSGDFLPSLGKGFLRTLYKGIIELGVGFGYVYEREGYVIGFAVGVVDSGTMFKKVLRHRGLRLGVQALWRAWRNLTLVKNTFDTFRYPNKEGMVLQRAELLVIAVRENFRGQGIGKALVNALNEEFCRRGILSYKVTVHKENEGANNFYRRLGFKYAYSFCLHGSEWNLHTYRIDVDQE